MSSGKSWMMGLAESKRRQGELMKQLRAKHLRIMKMKTRFAEIFGVSLQKFYKDIFLGFDVVEFDDWLRKNIEAYDEDKESMCDFLVRRFGQEAADMVKRCI